MSVFDLNRYYVLDDSFPGHFKVYEDGHFVCTGLTMIQAQDYCKGADLLDMNINQLMF